MPELRLAERELLQEDNFIFDPYLALYLPLYELDGASFMSRDVYGHSCSVTEATWNFQGRSFDGTNDLISVGTHSALNLGTSDFALEAWIKTSQTAERFLIGKDNAAGAWIGYYIMESGTGKAECYVNDGTNYVEFGTTAIDDGAWHHVVIMGDRDGNASITVDNRTPETTSMTSVGAVNPAGNFLLARRRAVYATCSVGEVRLYKRLLTPLEIQHNFFATKWRYK